ncbi:MAG: NYN domain-containing protein [Planctomycetaceae bacterium]|nr:NYN domain-containing protein [Planctomycetaceae bacterium]
MPYDLIIDAYNLMHYAGFVRRHYGPGDLERARDRFLKKLRKQLTEEERRRTTVVFDGTQQADSDQRDFQQFGMTILFSPFGLEADDVIEELIRQHSHPKQLIVVSSDHRLHRAAKARKANPLDSEVFLDTYEERKRTVAPERRESTSPVDIPEDVSEEELNQWLSEFGGVDPEEIRRSVEREARQQKKTETKPAVSQTPPPSTSPLKNSSEATSSSTSHVPADTELEETVPLVLNDDELAFWEKRIAELFEELE